MAEVVVSGEWLYDGTVPTLVRIVRLDFDFWFALAEVDGTLEPGEGPILNPEGHAYYLRYRPGWVEGERFWPDSEGFPDIETARSAAAEAVPSPITWL